MTRILVGFLALLSFFLPCAGQKGKSPNTPAQKYIVRKVTQEPFRSGLVGVLAVKMSRDTIADYRSLHKLLPASNVKLITTGLTLKGLGVEYRFTTTLGYDGEVKDGVLNGDLYIIGGGDPTIASGDRNVLPADSLFGRWKSMLDSVGIACINGRVIGDGRCFDGPIEHSSWGAGDLGTYYGAGGDGLCFYRNMFDIKVFPGTKPGEAIGLDPIFPKLPWLELRNRAITGPVDSDNTLNLLTTELAKTAQMRGSYPINRAPRIEQCSNKFGALTCAAYFTDYLKRNGLEVTGGAADIDAYDMVRPAFGVDSCQGFSAPSGSACRAADACKLKIIGRTFSPSLKEIAFTTNSRSDNFYAETMLRALSLSKSGSASYDSCMVVINRELDSLGVDASYGVRMVDGSGLARHNYISPDFMCRFLAAMAKTDVFEDFLQTISRPGDAGMRTRLAGQPASLKSRIFMKSGSMNGVVCYSGYVIPSSGRRDDIIVFSIMTNNCSGTSQPARDFMDGLIPLIAVEN